MGSIKRLEQNSRDKTRSLRVHKCNDSLNKFYFLSWYLEYSNEKTSNNDIVIT